jgi:beta-galactosidase
VGDFVWTALDYLGEVGIGRVAYEGEPEDFAAPYPWTIAGCGDIDICGDPKPQSHYRQILWDSRPRVACFVDNVAQGETQYKVTLWGWPDELPSWTWPGKKGKTLTVRVYSNCPLVRLELNGKRVGVAPSDRSTRFTANFEVKYEPGELVAVGLNGARREVCRQTLKTAGKPAALQVVPDRRKIAADGQDLCYVSVDLVDALGTVCPEADRLVRFSLSGPGRILAVGSGNPSTVESFQAGRRRTFRGRCWAILKASHRPGVLKLRASAGGVRSDEVVVQVG